MKQFFFKVVLSGLLMSPYLLVAQQIESVVISPAQPVSCKDVTVTVNMLFGCGNATLSSVSSTIVADTVFVNIYINQPLICLPVILPYITSPVIGMMPAGSYAIKVQTFTNFILAASSTLPLMVLCCDEDININQPTIPAGSYETMTQITAMGAVLAGGSVSFVARNQIQLMPEFSVETGVVLFVSAGGCPITAKK